MGGRWDLGGNVYCNPLRRAFGAASRLRKASNDDILAASGDRPRWHL